MKNILYFLVVFSMFWENSCHPVIAGQTQSLPTSLPLQKRIGVGIGGGYNNTSTSLKIEPDMILGDIGSTQSQTGNNFQVSPSLEFGAAIGNDYYLGLLASWCFLGKKISSRSPVRYPYYFVHEFKLSQYVDLLIKPGYKINPCTMVYGLIGPSIAQWSHTTRLYNGTNNGINQINMNKISVGLGLGLGFEYMIRKNYALSIDYTYHLHGSTSRTQGISYRALRGLVPVTLAGDVLKTVDPSYSTIAARFTVFFNF